MLGEQKYRRKLIPGEELWNAGVLEQWFQDMAAEGWALDRTGELSGVLRFRREPPIRCRYRCEVTAEGSAPGRETVELYGAGGWRYMGRLSRFYRVWRCDDPAAPELEMDPVAQSFGYERLRKKLQRESWALLAFLIAVLLFLFLKQDLMTERGTLSVDTIVHSVSYSLLIYPIIWFWGLLRGIRLRRALRRMEQTLAAGVPMDHTGDWRKARRRGRLWSGAYYLLVLLVLIPGLCGAAKHDQWKEEARANPPVVTVERQTIGEVEPDTYTVRLTTTPLTRQYTVREYHLDRRSADVELDVLAFRFLAEPLYQERAADYEGWELTAVTDSRFDQAAVVDCGRERVFLACRENLVLEQRVYAYTGDLREYLDEFAAIFDRYA